MKTLKMLFFRLFNFFGGNHVEKEFINSIVDEPNPYDFTR